MQVAAGRAVTKEVEVDVPFWLLRFLSPLGSFIDIISLDQQNQDEQQL